MASIESFLSEEYVNNNAEAHRRRPTKVSAPLITTHISIYYPSEFQRTFRPFLEIILNFLNHASPSNYSKEVFSRLSYFNGSPTQHIHPEWAALSDFIVEQNHTSIPGAKWRLEIHREYVSLTLFCPIQIYTSPKQTTINMLGDHEVGFSRSIDVKSTSYCDKILETVYVELPEYIKSSFNPLLSDLKEFGRTTYKPNTPHREPLIFAYFVGATLPWRVFSTCVDQHQQPIFPDPYTAGISDSMQDEYAAKASVFLMSLWDQGLEKHLVGNKEGPSLDCVACFVQRGHGLYVSSLGARQSTKDESPLRYLLLVADAKTDSKGNATTPPRSRRALVSAEDASWRLSRLVARLHDLGTARLAALRSQSQMKNFAQFLRRVEQDLQEREEGRNQVELREIESNLRKHADRVADSVVYRSNRTRYYYNMIHDTIDDLQIIALPLFQPYDHFLRRRIFSNLSYLSSIGDRYERVIQRINGLYGSRMAREILSIQRIADLVGSAILIYYSMKIAETLFHNAIVIGRLHFEIADEDSIGSVLVMGVAAAVYLGVSPRIFSTVAHMKTERQRSRPPSSARVWLREFIEIFSHGPQAFLSGLFLMPYAIVQLLALVAAATLQRILKFLRPD